MSVENEIAALTQAVDALASAVNVKRAVLDAAADRAEFWGSKAHVGAVVYLDSMADYPADPDPEVFYVVAVEPYAGVVVQGGGE
ncbi:hypothetical protein [Halodurantibacterium flavum]|uniref:Uncharacterized protein n=1 Tax=Halodurantibacterium flavum TaxID=1382802 RepID=A0ABW4SBE3_9RHOB